MGTRELQDSGTRKLWDSGTCDLGNGGSDKQTTPEFFAEVVKYD